MRAVKIPEIGRAELIEVEDPKAGPYEVVAKVHATGICGSDIAGFLGTHSFRVPPVIIGHELAGTVAELGKGVQDLDVGDVVVIANFEESPRMDFRKIHSRERELTGACQYTRRDYLKAIELFPTLKDSLAGLITHRISIEQLPGMLDNLSRGKVKNAIKVIVEMVK